MGGKYHVRESELRALGEDIPICSDNSRPIIIKSIAITTLLIRIQVNPSAELSTCINEIVAIIKFPQFMMGTT